MLLHLPSSPRLKLSLIAGGISAWTLTVAVLVSSHAISPITDSRATSQPVASGSTVASGSLRGLPDFSVLVE